MPYDDNEWPPPKRCAYCMAALPTCVCSPAQHSGWGGAHLCLACYAAVVTEAPVLPGRGLLDLDPLAQGGTS